MAYTSSQIVQAVPTGINSALVFVTGASFSAVTSVSLPTNTFTSTYRNYKIIIGFSSSSATQTISGRLRSAGADITTANYWQASSGVNTSNVTVNLADDTQTSWKLGNAGTTNVWGLTLDAIAPNISNTSKIFVGNLLYYNPTTSVNNGTSMNLLSYNGTPFQVDSLSIIASTGNFTGTYRIYGYSES